MRAILYGGTRHETEIEVSGRVPIIRLYALPGGLVPKDCEKDPAGYIEEYRLIPGSTPPFYRVYPWRSGVSPKQVEKAREDARYFESLLDALKENE